MLCLCRAAFAALVAVPVGYMLFAINSINGDGSYSLYHWLLREPESAVGRVAFGAVLGCLWHAISRLNSN